MDKGRDDGTQKMGMMKRGVDYSKWDKIEAELKEEEIKELVEKEKKMLYLDPEIPKVFKDKGNELFKKSDLAGAVSEYTSCIIMLTGERDPRARKKKTSEQLQKEQEKKQEEEKRQKEIQEKARSKDIKLPSGVKSVGLDGVDPDRLKTTEPEEPMDPMQSMAAGAGSLFTDDIDDDALEFRMLKCQKRILYQPELKQLLAQTYCNRANCEFKLSEGKDEKFKDKIKGKSEKKNPGGGDRWDNYKVRMTMDSLNDSRAAAILDPNYARAWYRIGACIERIMFLIDRLRDRKAWLREDELPILDKPSLYREAEESLQRSLELDPQPETHKLLVQMNEDAMRIQTFVRKMGHEKLCCDFDKNMVLTDVAKKGPSDSWRLDYYKGMKLLRVRVDKGGATARDWELRRDPVWVEVEDLPHLIKEQTHASKVDFEFTPVDWKPREVAGWECYAPAAGGKPQPKRQGKYGRPPPRKRSSGHGPLIVALVLAIVASYALWLLVRSIGGAVTSSSNQEL